MPSRDPTYYRWSQDKPVTTNQTYGYGLVQQQGSTTSTSGQRGAVSCCNGTATSCNQDGDDRFSHHACVQCPDCESSTSRGGRLCERHRRREKTVTPSVKRFSAETAVKPINKGYTAGQVPVTKKIAASGGGGSMAGVQLERGTTSRAPYEYKEPDGKDMYLWHALSGSLVHCKHYGPADDIDY